MVTFDTGTKFPAVRRNPLFAVAMMNIRHRWNGIGVPTQSHPNAASRTLSPWNISISVPSSFIVGIFHLIYDVFKLRCSLFRTFKNAYQIRNSCIYYVTNNKQHASSIRFPGEQLRLRNSHRRVTTNNYGITFLLHATESFSRNYPSSASQIPHFLWNPKFHYIF